MESETCVEGTITIGEVLPTPETNGESVDDLIPHRMIVANGDLGDGSVLVPSDAPKVLEMDCEAEHNTENTKDYQKYASKLNENTTTEDDGCIVKEKQYEENAIRSHSEKTEDTEVSSKSQIKYEENEKIRQTEDKPTVAEYNARSEETHDTSVSTTEAIGDSLVTRTRSSSKNVSKSFKRIEEIDEDNLGGITESGREEDLQSSALETNDVDSTIIKRMEKSHKSERYETKIVGREGDVTVLDKYEALLSDSNQGASIDLGALGEIKLSTQISSAENTLNRDFQQQGITFSSNNISTCAEESKHNNLVNEQHGQSDKHVYSESSERQSSTHAHNEASYSMGSHETYSLLGSESSYSSTPHNMAHENGEVDCKTRPGEKDFSKGNHPPFVPKDRKSADDLVKRILAESKMEKSGGSKKQRIKVDMGGGAGDISSSPFSSLPCNLNAAEASESTEASSNSLSFSHESREEHVSTSSTSAGNAENLEFTERAVGAERRRTPAESDEEGDRHVSLVQRRLGVENSLGNIFTGTEASTSTGAIYSSEDLQSRYTSKRMEGENQEDDILTRYSRKVQKDIGDRDEYQPSQYKHKPEPDDFDELDHEISALRDRYKVNQGKTYQALYGDMEDYEEDMPRHKPRGYMMRQGYVEDDQYGRPVEDDFIPDEDFAPSRRAETEDVVKERTTDIRNVVEKQSTVLQKLKDASDSFDELTNEIRSIKQQFLENQARRSFIMDNDDEYEQEELAPPPTTRGRYQRSQSYDYGYSKGSYSGYSGYSGRSAALDNELDSDLVSPGRSLGIASTYKPYSSRYGSEEETSVRSSRFSSKKANWGRSKSMHDDNYGGTEKDNNDEGSGFRAGRWGATQTRSKATNEDDDEEGSDRPTRSRAYGGGVTMGGESDYSTSSYTRGNYESSGSGYTSRFSSSYSPSDYKPISSPRLGYSSRFLTGETSSRPTFTRSKTLSDFNFDKQSTDSFGSGGNSGYTSRFLQKVRDDRKSGATDPKSPGARDKPFKSRFLKSSFDTDYSSSSYSSRFKSSSTYNSSSTSGIGSTASSSSNTSNDVTEPNATTESAATDE